MKMKTKSIIISTLLYILLALMWCGIAFIYLVLFIFSDIMNYVWDGLLKYLFIVVSFVCILIPIIFRKKLKLKLSLLLIVFTILSVGLNFILHCTASCYISNYTKEKWSNNYEMRYRMLYSLENKYEMTGKDEREIEVLLGKPDFADDTSYFYIVGVVEESCYTYELFFHNGTVIRTEVRWNNEPVDIESLAFLR